MVAMDKLWLKWQDCMKAGACALVEPEPPLVSPAKMMYQCLIWRLLRIGNDWKSGWIKINTTAHVKLIGNFLLGAQKKVTNETNKRRPGKATANCNLVGRPTKQWSGPARL